MRAGSVISRSRTMNACFDASTRPCRCANPSASVTLRRSKMPRIMSDAKPCVGGGKLYAVPGRSGSASGAFTCARCRSRSAPETGLPIRAKSAATAVRERAAVERVESLVRETAQRVAESLVHEPVACRGGRTVGEELLREPWHVFELGALVAGVGVLARGDRHAVLGVVDGVGQQPIERVRAAPAPADRERRLPSRYRARHGIRREGPPGRDGVEPQRSIPLGGGLRRGPAARIDRNRFRVRCADDPEPVAADGVHVRIDDGDGGGGGNHRLDGVAAFAQHRESGLGGEMVRSDDHAPGGGSGMDHFR